MTHLLAWCAENWWIIFIAWWFGVFGFVAGFLDELRRAYKRMIRNRRKHQLAVKRLELRIAQTEAQREEKSLVRTPLPGPCVHRRVTSVVDKSDKVVAWLCKNCDEQLPADWAVRAEDL